MILLVFSFRQVPAPNLRGLFSFETNDFQVDSVFQLLSQSQRKSADYEILAALEAFGNRSFVSWFDPEAVPPIVAAFASFPPSLLSLEVKNEYRMVSNNSLAISGPSRC